MLYTMLNVVRVMVAALFVVFLGVLAVQMAFGLLLFKAWTWQPPPPDQDHLVSTARSVLYAANTKTMDRPWVRDQFGEPRDAPGFPAWDEAFHLGPKPGLFSFDDLWLCVEYDEDGFVKAATIVDR